MLMCFFLQESIKARVFEVLMYFVNYEDEIVKEKVLSGLGKI